MLFLYKFWQDEPQRLNRCAYVHRPQGCRQGAACRFCHIHPVSDADYKKRTGRGWGKKESAEQKKDRLAAHEAKKAIGQERRLAKADLQGYLRYGKVLKCGSQMWKNTTFGQLLDVELLKKRERDRERERQRERGE